MQHIKYYIPGVMLILMAGFIIVFPEILVAIISIFIMAMGILVLYIGHGIWKSEIKWRKMDGRYQTSSWHRYCFYR